MPAKNARRGARKALESNATNTIDSTITLGEVEPLAPTIAPLAPTITPTAVI